MKMLLDEKKVRRFVKNNKTKLKFTVLPKRLATSTPLTINFKEAKAMVDKNNFYIEVE